LGKADTPYQEEISLVKAVRNGDHNAFRKIVLNYENMVARVITGMIGNTTDADDIGQETFIRFYRSIEQFKGDSSLGTYLTRIAINLTLNEIKRKKSKYWLSYEDNILNDQILANPSAQFEKKEIVEMAMSILDPDFRSVVVLRLMQGYSTKETAEILKLPLGTVLSRLARAQDKLRKIIQNLEK
jgi:RNA polymerase sigma-70 factor (ECF subfamily)